MHVAGRGEGQGRGEERDESHVESDESRVKLDVVEKLTRFGTAGLIRRIRCSRFDGATVAVDCATDWRGLERMGVGKGRKKVRVAIA